MVVRAFFAAPAPPLAFAIGMCLAFSVGLAAQVARAQEPRPEAVAAASAAFREGQAAQLAGDYARAAEMFELADDSAPSGAALRSAIRSRRAAGHVARAATLSAEAIARYPDEAETRALADATIAELGPTLGRAVLMCEPACSASIDGRSAHEAAAVRLELYVDPGAHDLVVAWTGREPTTRHIELSAGQTFEESFTAPPEAVVAVADPIDEEEVDEVVEPAPTSPPPPTSSGITPIVFGALVGLTAVSGGVLIWSGIDVLSARDAYVAMPSRAGYEDGISRELRTNVLIGVTGALALGTLVTAFFTDFGGGSAPSSDSPTALVVPTEGGAFVMGGGRW